MRTTKLQVSPPLNTKISTPILPTEKMRHSDGIASDQHETTPDEDLIMGNTENDNDENDETEEVDSYLSENDDEENVQCPENHGAIEEENENIPVDEHLILSCDIKEEQSCGDVEHIDILTSVELDRKRRRGSQKGQTPQQGRSKLAVDDMLSQFRNKYIPGEKKLFLMANIKDNPKEKAIHISGITNKSNKYIEALFNDKTKNPYRRTHTNAGKWFTVMKIKGFDSWEMAAKFYVAWCKSEGRGTLSRVAKAKVMCEKLRVKYPNLRYACINTTRGDKIEELSRIAAGSQ